MKYNEIVIGIDQSYKRTGISICADNKILKITSIDLSKYKTHSEARRGLYKRLKYINDKIYHKGNITCLIERIRLRSDGFLNINYIKSIGALNATIVDVMDLSGIKVYSVDTRSWKSKVVGTSKPKSNHFGVDPKKYPTIEWVIKQGFEDSILVPIYSQRKNKGTFIKDGQKFSYNDDAADSAAISKYWFVGDRELLKIEK